MSGLYCTCSSKQIHTTDKEVIMIEGKYVRVFSKESKVHSQQKAKRGKPEWKSPSSSRTQPTREPDPDHIRVVALGR